MAASPSSVEPPKHWLIHTLDIFTTVESNESIEIEWFEKEIETLEQTIYRLAIIKFELIRDTPDLNVQDTFNAMLKEPQSTRADFLARSILFKNLARAAQLPISKKNTQHYYNTFIRGMMNGYEKTNKKDLASLKESKDIKDWICSVIQTVITPLELTVMHQTFKNMDQNHFRDTLTDRHQIGQKLDSSILCTAIQQLLEKVVVSNEERKEVPADDVVVVVEDRTVPKEESLFTDYLTKIVNTSPLENRQAVKQNLIVSLGIRARQLP